MYVSKDFIEKISLLMLTAILTGFLVPYILKTIDDGRLRRSKVIEAQSKFLDDISHILWKWRYLSIKVVYYANRDSIEKYKSVKKEYDENIWEVFNQVRSEISKSRRLVSEKSYKDLLELYTYMVELDKKISSLIERDGPESKWENEASILNTLIYVDVTKKIDEIVNSLATELHLKKVE